MDNAYYITFETGRITSVSHGHGLEERGLLKMMQQRQWLSPDRVTEPSINAHQLGQPLGTYLKSCNATDGSPLRLLFDAQRLEWINCRITRSRVGTPKSILNISRFAAGYSTVKSLEPSSSRDIDR